MILPGDKYHIANDAPEEFGTILSVDYDCHPNPRLTYMFTGWDERGIAPSTYAIDGWARLDMEKVS